jgi:hypothetical protein
MIGMNTSTGSLSNFPGFKYVKLNANSGLQANVMRDFVCHITSPLRLSRFHLPLDISFEAPQAASHVEVEVEAIAQRS